MESSALTLTSIMTTVGEVLTSLLSMMTNVVNWIFTTPGVAIWAYSAIILIVFAAVARFVRN